MTDLRCSLSLLTWHHVVRPARRCHHLINIIFVTSRSAYRKMVSFIAKQFILAMLPLLHLILREITTYLLEITPISADCDGQIVPRGDGEENRFRAHIQTRVTSLLRTHLCIRSQRLRSWNDKGWNSIYVWFIKLIYPYLTWDEGWGNRRNQ